MTTSDHVGQPPLTDPTGHAHRTDQANPSGHTDPTLYRTPADAIAAPPEKLAYLVGFDRSAQRPDALITVDTDPESSSYGRVLHMADVPGLGDELHHFGWNACSSALAHEGHHQPERRYLLTPGLAPPGCTSSTPTRTRPAPAW